jgi:hypothetical protein
LLASPSGISTFDLCQRKWAWRTIDKVPGVANPYAEFGTAVHGILEGYLKSGIMPDLTTPEGMCALEFLHVLPPPGTPGLAIEQHVQVPPFHGYPDVLEPGEIPTVHDHKTCGTHQYAIQDLKSDVQAAVYAHFAFTLYPVAPAVNLRWNYVTRRRPKLLPVHQIVTRADIAPTLARAATTAQRMAAVTATTALDLPPNPIACEQYGGCQYRSLCNLTAQDKLTALLAQETRMSTFTPESFLAQVAAQTGAAPLPPPPPRGNPWDELPQTHQTATHYCPDGVNWVPKGPPAPPPPPPAPVAALPPPPPAPTFAINPPPVNGAPPPAPPAPPAATEPKRRGRPPKVAGSVAAAEGTGGWPAVADALRALADAIEGL